MWKAESLGQAEICRGRAKPGRQERSGPGGTVRRSWDRGEDGAGAAEAGVTWIGNDRVVLTGWEAVAGLAALAQRASWGS